MKFNTVYIGNLALDINSFYYGKEKEQLRTKNYGGACFYSAIPASLFYRVGIVGKIGYDFDKKVFEKYNVDTTGIKTYQSEKTISFHQIYKDKNQKNREIEEFLNPKLEIKEKDIPIKYLNCKHIHITTNKPEVQLRLIKYIRRHSKAIISVDTIQGFSDNFITQEVFNLADIAFIDQEFKQLLENSKTKVKIIKKVIKDVNILVIKRILQ